MWTDWGQAGYEYKSLYWDHGRDRPKSRAHRNIRVQKFTSASYYFHIYTTTDHCIIRCVPCIFSHSHCCSKQHVHKSEHTTDHDLNSERCDWLRRTRKKNQCFVIGPSNYLIGSVWMKLLCCKLGCRTAVLFCCCWCYLDFVYNFLQNQRLMLHVYYKFWDPRDSCLPIKFPYYGNRKMILLKMN